jgi:hypothetical protein
MADPLIACRWTLHDKLPHVSGPHVVSMEGERWLFAGCYGENDAA